VPACAAERVEMVAIPEGTPERTSEAVAQHYLAGLERKVLLKKRSPHTLRKARWTLRDHIFSFVGSKPIDSRDRARLLPARHHGRHARPVGSTHCRTPRLYHGPNEVSRQAIEVVRELLATPVESRYFFPAPGHPERPMSENPVRVGHRMPSKNSSRIWRKTKYVAPITTPNT
jgi:hypothetical protein